jgi:hypothetical protein
LRFGVARGDYTELLVRLIVLAFCDAAKGLVDALVWRRQREEVPLLLALDCFLDFGGHGEVVGW